MQTDTPHYRFGRIFFASLAVVLLTRLPIIPDYLYSFDSVNLALALDDFDPARNQPQPPGYPLFVGEARIFNFLLGDAGASFTLLKILLAALGIGVIYVLGREVRSHAVGLAAAALMLFTPTFWYGSLTSPLRLHMVVLGGLLGLACWRALKGEVRWFYIASLALGIGGGFRPVLEVVMFPLWAWVGWRVGGWKLLARGLGLLLIPTLIWVGVLVAAMGGPEKVVIEFLGYLRDQTQQTALVTQAAQMSWRRMATRAILWTFIGTLGWIWLVPLVWRERMKWESWPLFARFALIWFVPPFLFNMVVHTADPDHTLKTLPVLALVGGLCLVAAEERFANSIDVFLRERGFALLIAALILLPVPFLPPEHQGKLLVLSAAAGLIVLLLLRGRNFNWSCGGFGAGRGPLMVLALVCNIIIFFGDFPLPMRDPAQTLTFRGLKSAADALAIGTYETSYRRVEWTEIMTDQALADIGNFQARDNRELLVVWTSGGAPVWRKVAYYYPQVKVLVLEESGDPASLITRARLWRGSWAEKLYRGAAPIRVDVPAGGRLVWLLAGGRESELSKHIPIKKAVNVFYTDIPAAGAQFQWGSFEFVAPPAVAQADSDDRSQAMGSAAAHDPLLARSARP